MGNNFKDAVESGRTLQQKWKYEKESRRRAAKDAAIHFQSIFGHDLDKIRYGHNIVVDTLGETKFAVHFNGKPPRELKNCQWDLFLIGKNNIEPFHGYICRGGARDGDSRVFSDDESVRSALNDYIVRTTFDKDRIDGANRSFILTIVAAFAAIAILGLFFFV